MIDGDGDVAATTLPNVSPPYYAAWVAATSMMARIGLERLAGR
jgi:hypothetical protein